MESIEMWVFDFCDFFINTNTLGLVSHLEYSQASILLWFHSDLSQGNAAHQHSYVSYNLHQSRPREAKQRDPFHFFALAIVQLF